MGGCRRGDRGGLVRCRAGERVDEDEKLKRFLRGKGVPIPPSKKAASTPTPKNPDVDDDSIASLRFFDLDTVRQRWDVPWGGWRVFFGLSGWTASFVLTAGVVAPVLLEHVVVALRVPHLEPPLVHRAPHRVLLRAARDQIGS